MYEYDEYDDDYDEYDEEYNEFEEEQEENPCTIPAEVYGLIQRKEDLAHLREARELMEFVQVNRFSRPGHSDDFLAGFDFAIEILEERRKMEEIR